MIAKEPAESRSNQPITGEPPPFPSFEGQIAAIRGAFSMQMKELAEAIGVERPTVYSWINDQNLPQLANRQRLQSLYHLAKQWTQLTNRPLGRLLHQVDSEGRSLFDMLREMPIPTSTIADRLRVIAQTGKAVSPPNHTNVRQLARKHNMDLKRVGDNQADIDLETGKRIDAG